MVEKLLALSGRARNEPRDLYDLWYLFGATGLRIAELRTELDAKLASRQRTAAGIEQAIAAKEDRLRRLWTNRLAHQMRQLPSHDGVFREVLRMVRALTYLGPDMMTAEDGKLRRHTRCRQRPVEKLMTSRCNAIRWSTQATRRP